ncbi:hypothetical protein [Spartinivicinus poritis]|uniref:Uncharacterized protein n=1 Tax=Spartinivicinus poritis TaxID=2994640 RepID=A0ABT5UG99_9GAMM|nr:hypothetical protein [Spartinivicinus sp. A2-2]MDE1464099.1 hypothetical protein [Spartinivicinus sp. A2-2]
MTPWKVDQQVLNTTPDDLVYLSNPDPVVYHNLLDMSAAFANRAIKKMMTNEKETVVLDKAYSK